MSSDAEQVVGVLLQQAAGFTYAREIRVASFQPAPHQSPRLGSKLRGKS